jgi:hypothetical protein
VVELALRRHRREVEDATDGRLGGQSAGGAPRFKEEAIATWRGRLPPSGQKSNGRYPYPPRRRLIVRQDATTGAEKCRTDKAFTTVAGVIRELGRVSQPRSYWDPRARGDGSLRRHVVQRRPPDGLAVGARVG